METKGSIWKLAIQILGNEGESCAERVALFLILRTLLIAKYKLRLLFSGNFLILGRKTLQVIMFLSE